MKTIFSPRRIAVPTRRPRGAVLVVALLFLLIITMLGVTTMQSTISGERMAGNMRDQNNALHAAEAAMRDARMDIQGTCSPRLDPSNCTKRSPLISGATGFGDASAAPGTCSAGGLCMPVISNPGSTRPRFAQPNLAAWDNPGTLSPVTFGTYTQPGGASSNSFPRAARQPEYIMEAMCVPTQSIGFRSQTGNCPYLYRVSARGYGSNANTRVTLQGYLLPQ